MSIAPARGVHRMLPGCDAEGCDFGWRWVTNDYIEALFPLPNGDLFDPIVVEQTKVVLERRATFAGAVFPCPDCRPDEFRRWAAGCWAPAHRGCEVCQEGRS